MFDADRLLVLQTITPFLAATPHWSERFDVEWYVDRCRVAGFADTPDQIRLCASRYLAGKRRITAPGTQRRKEAEKKRKQAMAALPQELVDAVQAALRDGSKAVEQYKAGSEKAINALIGAVMKRHKADPALIRDLLLRDGGLL